MQGGVVAGTTHAAHNSQLLTSVDSTRGDEHGEAQRELVGHRRHGRLVNRLDPAVPPAA
jgi:hypothetical protein